jgi:sortase B
MARSWKREDDCPMKDGNNLGGKNKYIWKIAVAVLLVVAMVCVGVACARKAKEDAAQDTFEQLAERTSKVPLETQEPSSEGVQPTEEPLAESEESADILGELGVPVPEKEVDFEDLQQNVNKDIYAWIYIPDTKIDYPILQHPTDNVYYLDGSSGYPGCIYSEDYNKKDFSDPVTVLYGHNMKNGNMFAGLHKYSDSEYLAEHPYIYIYTPDGMLVYQIFAVHQHSNEHLLYGKDYTRETIMESYIGAIERERSMVSVEDEAIEVDVDSHILTLSTCISNKPNNRLLVQGVLLNGE